MPLGHLHGLMSVNGIAIFKRCLSISIVAYDMLRAYYSRINQSLPDPQMLGTDFVDTLDHSELRGEEARNLGRAMIRKIQSVVETAQVPSKSSLYGDENLRAWLVTDFVTLGSPLTHAHYLMCNGETEEELEQDFRRRANELEFPTCPPPLVNGDGRLTFIRESDSHRCFHHGGLFGLTRWTNLYFRASELLWGDPIGGWLAPVFGENIVDVQLYTNKLKHVSFFAHTLYWALPPKEGGEAPHIQALIEAINLAEDCCSTGS